LHRPNEAESLRRRRVDELACMVAARALLHVEGTVFCPIAGRL